MPGPRRRVHWHIYGVMRDTSDYAYSPALGYAAAFMSLNTFVFCLLVAFIFLGRHDG